MLAVAVQRDGAADGREGPEALVAAFDPQFLIEQAPPDHDGFAGELRVDLVGDAGNGQTAVDADLAPFRLPREGAEPLPGAHLADAVGRQVRQPIIDPRVRFGSMIAAIVGDDEPCQPEMRSVSFIVRRKGPIISTSLRRKWPMIACRPGIIARRYSYGRRAGRQRPAHTFDIAGDPRARGAKEYVAALRAAFPAN